MPYWRLTRYCEPFNLTGHPALAMPFAMDVEGMPIGIQLVGQHGQDQRLIELAAAISSERTVLGPALPRMVPACG
jgi:Asp-tRNA(Asn)/Glu-tRNA(Gln) amidotransferase A subunit family amidase